MTTPKPKKRTKIDWKKIAVDLRKSVGCGCCADYDERYRAIKRFDEAMELDESGKDGEV